MTSPVLVLTPMKDASQHLGRYFELLGQLDYPKDCLSLGFLEGNSHDDTYGQLQQRLDGLRATYRRVTLIKQDFPWDDGKGARWRVEIQRARRSAIARSRNLLLSESLTDEEWVLWLDADLSDYPPRLLNDLLHSGKSIVVANCLQQASGDAFDLNTFVDTDRWSVMRWWRRLRYTRSGLYQPPRGYGRRYLTDFQDHGEPVALAGVGGTALLVRADLHRQGLCFPPAPYRGLIETEGLSAMARDMGIQSWGLPGLIVRHSDT